MAGDRFIRPSKLAAIALCPGRAWAEEEARQAGHTSPSSQAAIDGTRRHALLEWKWFHPTLPWPLTVPSDRGEDWKILSTDVMEVEKLWPHYAEHPYRKDEISGRVWVEQHVDVGKPLGYDPDTIVGTADNVFAYDNVFEVDDHKFGHRLVRPDSWQLKAYAIGAGALVDWPGLHRKIGNDTGVVRLTVSQPANTSNRINSVDFPINTMIDEWKPQLRSIIDAAVRRDAPRIPSEEACRYCLAGETQRCPERRKFMADTLKEVTGNPTPVAFGPIASEPDSANPDTLAPVASVDAIQDIAETKLTQDPAELDNAALGRLCDQAGLIRGFFDSVEKELHRRLTKGEGEGSGYKLVEGQGSREYTVDDAEVEKTLKACGLKVSEIYTKKLPSVAQAEAKIKIKGPKKTERFNEIWRRKPGKPTLAPLADARKAINEPAFEAVETPPPADTQPAKPSWLD